MSIQLTGTKRSIVRDLQARLDHFSSSSRSCAEIQVKITELMTQHLELSDIPGREDRLQVLLTEYKEATDRLKHDARQVENKTDQSHIKNYFKLRNGPWYARNSRYRHIDWRHEGTLKQAHEIAFQTLNINYEAEAAKLHKEAQQRKEEAQAALEILHIDL